MYTNKKFYFYFFESGYRTGACRLTAKEIKELSKIYGELMKKEVVPEIW